MKNQKKNPFLTVAFAIVMMFILATAVFTYDSSSDPVVTLSYLNDVFLPQIKQDVFASVSALFDEGEDDGEAYYEPNNSYEVVELEEGRTLRAKGGSLEIILRPGGGAVCISENDMGLSDITAGIDIMNGEELSANHYVVIPRADGRGVVATGAVAYLMVRGGYEIE